MTRPVRVLLLVLAAVIVFAAVGVLVSRPDLVPLPTREACVATVGDQSVRVNLEQAEHASLIAAISVERGMPARAATIAIATAYQESKLHNIDFGDRDSVGLFQQRPSQGWGTVRQIMDPVYATNRFYDGLEKVDGYQRMAVTEAAQAVQRSAYPEAYADHEADARILASALTGETRGGAFACVIRGEPSESSTELGPRGLTPRAGAVRRELAARFPGTPLGGFAPGGVSTGHMEGSAHYDGRAVDAFVRPINETNNRRGWAIAAYLVANADRLDIATVIFDAKIWTRRRSSEGWRDYTVPSGRDGSAVVLEHRDHVHVDVYP